MMDLDNEELNVTRKCGFNNIKPSKPCPPPAPAPVNIRRRDYEMDSNNIQKAIEYFNHSLKFQTDAEVVKNIMIAIKCMEYYEMFVIKRREYFMDENEEENHIPRID